MIENEVKYILDLNCSFDDAKKSIIYQGYDKNGARVRNQNGKYTFNYKMKNQDFIEEFEMNITQEEFDRCYEYCVEKLKKIRFTIKDEYLNTWDIDFFYSREELYFAMAECEMNDPYKQYPDKILPIVEENCLYAVPRSETRKFSSRKLSDVEYAKKMLESIKNPLTTHT